MVYFLGFSISRFSPWGSGIYIFYVMRKPIGFFSFKIAQQHRLFLLLFFVAVQSDADPVSSKTKMAKVSLLQRWRCPHIVFLFFLLPPKCADSLRRWLMTLNTEAPKCLIKLSIASL